MAIEYSHDPESLAYATAVGATCALACEDLAAALVRVESLCDGAQGPSAPARRAVLAALALQLIVSDFANLRDLPVWGARLVAAPVAPGALTADAALIYCAGAIAAQQFADALGAGVAAQLPSVADCAQHYRERVLAGGAAIDVNVLVASAEHVASWWANAGERGAIDEVSVVIERRLADPALAPQVRSRWLFWLGCIHMQTDQRALAEATWARAQDTAPAREWPWLQFHLQRVSVRALLEDGRRVEAQERVRALKQHLDPARPLDLGDYHHLQGWLALQDDEPRVAAQHYRLALEAAQRAALPAHMRAIYEGGMAQSLICTGDEAGALAVWRSMAFVSGPRGDALRATCIALTEACAARRLGRADYEQHLAQGLRAARELGLLRFFRLVPRMAAQLCADALARGIEAEFAGKVIASRGLAPPANAGDAWPWPIKLYGLRPFALVIDDEPLLNAGKMPAKPLQLLKLLLAHAGGPIALMHAYDALWPELDAAEARRAFDVTVNRLRGLLVHRDAVLVGEGKVGLDLQRVWLDTHAFADAVRRTADLRNLHEGAMREALFEELMRLYRQPLLTDDGDAPWALDARRRLNRQFNVAIDALAAATQAAGDRERAALMRRHAAAVAG